MKTTKTTFKQTMTKEELKKILGNGFNANLLATALWCSVGRINELRKQPVEGQVYHAADINIDAIYDFATLHEIDLSAIDFTEIIKVKEKNAKVDIQEGTKLNNGEEVIKIQKVGNTYVYITNNMTVLSAKQIAELV